MLKDVFASERRKAKTLNFSIAYGKTKHGLAKDWNVDLEVRLYACLDTCIRVKRESAIYT